MVLALTVVISAGVVAAPVPVSAADLAETDGGGESVRPTADLVPQIERLQRRLTDMALIVREREIRVADLEEQLAVLAGVEAETKARLDRARDQTGRVLMALQRLARYPAAALVVQPLGPADTVRSGIVLRAAVGELERRSDRLRADLVDLAETRGRADARREELVDAIAALGAEREKAEKLLTSKMELSQRVATGNGEARARIRVLSGQSRTVRELIAGLARTEEDSKAAAEGARPIPPKVALTPPSADKPVVNEAHGTLSDPVVGRLIHRYGEDAGLGIISKGITIETAPGALVVTPLDGRVVFAGAFRGYGRLLIIEHGDGYHILLAGMDRIHSVIGQLVFKGEPVGTMGSPDNGKPSLYLEIRSNNQPVDPLPWLSTPEVEVSG